MEKPYYLSGEVAVGRVDLEVFTPINGANSLMIKWKGFERTFVQDTIVRQDQNGTQRRETRNIRDQKDFFKTALVLFSFQGRVVLPGKFSFPFSFQLPINLPSVFHYDYRELDGDLVRGAIVYKVKCWLDMPGRDIKVTEKMIISEAFTKTVVPVFTENKKSFLFARGNLKMEALIEKNVFIPGETVPIKVKVVNESSKKVEHLKAKLMRIIYVRAREMIKERKEEVSRMVFDGVHEKATKETVLTFQIAPEAFPTTNGDLVRCKYHLDIECDVAMAIDLEVHPAITVALLPAVGQPVFLYQNYAPRTWAV